MKEDEGRLKTKKDMNKVIMVLTQEVNIEPKIKQTTSIQPYTSTALCLYFIA